MKRFVSIPCLLLVSAVAVSAVQERVKKGPADFKTLHTELGRAWEAKRYGACLEHARGLMTLIGAKRAEVILAALPAAPAGYEVEAPSEDDQAPNPFAAAMTATMGSVAERTYRAKNGRGEVQVTVTADSPLVQMFSMWVANPEMLGQEGELIKYGKYSAVLKKEGGGYNLQILVETSICEVDVRGEDDEFLFKMFDQAAVDKLAAAILE